MYIVYFLIRRFLTGTLLIVFVEYPFFQCVLLLVMSTMNFIYIVSVKPLENTKQNRIEIFNELCIMVCAHLYNIFLRGEGSLQFLNGTGWTFMGTAAFNIIGNMGIVIMDSLSGFG